MDNILDPAWQIDEKPFQAESLILEDWIPLGMLRQALIALTDYCQARYDCCALYGFDDWHEKNGQLSRRRRSSYGELRANLASDLTLQASSPGPGLYCAYYSETADFLLRYSIAPVSPNSATASSTVSQTIIWGDFSFSGSSEDIRGAIAQLKPIPGLPLNLMGSASYFDATCGR
jgi:hypothetical protein